MANRSQKDDAEVESAQTGTVIPPNAFQRLLAKMDAIATLDTAQERYTGDDIIRILEAESEELMWDSDEVPSINAKMLSGCALEIIEFSVKYSNDPEINTHFVTAAGKKMYLVLRSSRLDKSGEKAMLRLPEPHEEFQWNTSARFIVAKLFWLLEHGYFDDGRSVQARIVGTNIGGGKSVEKLKPLTYTTVPGDMPDSEPPF